MTSTDSLSAGAAHADSPRNAATPTCPRCFTACPSPSTEPDSPVAGACPSCGLEFLHRGGMLDVLGVKEREERAAEVEAFYTKSPFPGYAPGETGASLLDKLRAIPFMAAMDAAIPEDADVLDAGCGTGQLAAFLALCAPRRRVFGVDGSRASLTHAEEYRARAGIDNLQLVRSDLFELPIEPGRFKYVISRGVVHHTPDPDLATEKVANCVAPGGFFVLGFYETMGRRFHCIRRGLGKPYGKFVATLDPVLRRKDLDDEKKRIWIEDQYLHPLEHILPLPRVERVLGGLGFRTLRTIPPHVGAASFFEPESPRSGLGTFARRFGWMMRGINDPDAGLVLVVAKRHEDV